MQSFESRFSTTARSAQASDIRELLKLTARPDMITFAGGLPDPTLFPTTEFTAAMERVMATAGGQSLQYGTTEGLHSLREELVRQLDAEAIICPEQTDHILLTTGSQQALDLVGRLLIDPGDTVIIEAPSYLGALQAFNARAPHYASVPLDAGGMQLDRLEATLNGLKREGRRPKFLYTVPTFQNPAGVTLTLERRKALLELADREDFLIVEDDPYARLRFRGTHLPSLKSMDHNQRVITLRTFSKTLSPGLRTGYVIASPAIIRRLVILKQAADLCSSPLSHYLVAEMIASGALEAYLQRVIEVYRAKAETMAAALKHYLGSSDIPVRWNEPDGGMFFWLQLPEGMDSGDLLAQAIESGVAFVKGTAFYPGGSAGRNAMRLNFSQPSQQQIEAGVARLATAIEQYARVGV